MKKFMLMSLLLLTVGCSLGRQNPQYSFILQPSVQPPPCPQKFALTLPSITADEPYNTYLLAYSPSPLEVEFYAYHRWAAPLPDLVTQAVRESLKKWGCVTLVPFTHQVPVLQGRIIRFVHRIQGGESWGEVAIQFTLLKGEKVLAQKTFQAQVKAQEVSPKAAVEALNKALERVITYLLTWLEEQRPKATAAE
jgi:ABC-type uncharacterized transport system auxiliary subunit